MNKREWTLDFISEEDYKKHVKEYFKKINSLTEPKDISEFNKNIIDPIKMTFSYFITGEDIDEIISTEQTRQVDKSINNDIGYFHQNIFKYVEGWKVPIEGFDIVNEEETIFVELKNKHNTMNANSSQKTYINMLQKRLEYSEKGKEVTCMLVEIIARRSQNIPWNVTVDKQAKSDKYIRRVSIDKFYEIATGDKYAFRKVVAWLPITLKEIVIEDKSIVEGKKIVEELTKEKSFFINLYQLAFDTYEGFENLNFIEDEVLGEDFKDKNNN